MDRNVVRKIRRNAKVGSSNRFWLLDLFRIVVAGKQGYVFAVIDDLSKECLHFALITQPSGNNIRAALDRTSAQWGKPEGLITDCSALWSAPLKAWSTDNTVAWMVMQCRSPWHKGRVERLFQKMDLPNAGIFASVEELKQLLHLKVGIYSRDGD